MTPPKALKEIDKIDSVSLAGSPHQEVAVALSGILASTYMLYHKALFYHWNVTGSSFVGLHELFEKQYNELHEAGDVLAERVRALGSFTPGTMHDFMALSRIEEDKALPFSPDAMVKNLLLAQEACAEQTREVKNIADEAEDDVTADLMVERMAAHEKAAWMLRSILQ